MKRSEFQAKYPRYDDVNTNFTPEVPEDDTVFAKEYAHRLSCHNEGVVAQVRTLDEIPESHMDVYYWILVNLDPHDPVIRKHGDRVGIKVTFGALQKLRDSLNRYLDAAFLQGDERLDDHQNLPHL